MNRFRYLTLPVFLLLALLLTGAAPDDEGAPVRKPAKATSPMIQEILDSREASRARVAELTASLAGIIDREEILRVEREIEQEKNNAFLRMVRIQIRYARARGDDVLADQMETGLEKMARPQLEASHNDNQGEG